MSVSNVTGAPEGVRDNVAMREPDQRSEFRGCAGAAANMAAHARARQLAVDVPAHGVANGLDIARYRAFAALSQPGGVCGKRG